MRRVPFSNSRGFTLIEMLLVIALIILIAGLALARFLDTAKKGRIAEAMGELRTLHAAVESYVVFNSVGVPPGNNNELREVGYDDVRIPLENANPRIVGNLLGDYDDPFERGHRYKYKRNGKFYIIFSAGPSGTYHEPVINADTGEITELQSDDLFVTNAKNVTFL